MNQSIKFVNDSARGLYAEDDTGTLVSFCRSYTDDVVGVILMESGKYITAPLADFEAVSSDES